MAHRLIPDRLLGGRAAVVLGLPGLVAAPLLGPAACGLVAIALPAVALSWAVSLGGGGQGPTATS